MYICLGSLLLGCGEATITLPTIFVDILFCQALLLLSQGAEQSGEEARVARVAGVAAGMFGGAAEVVIFGTVAAGGVGSAVCHFVRKKGSPMLVAENSWLL